MNGLNILRALFAWALVAPLAPAALGAPTPLSACVAITKPGSYVLNRSLSSAGDCILIQTDFVTLDLDGQVITGNGMGTGITDNGVGRVGITVRNGIVRNFENGIAFGSDSVVMIDRVNVLGNANLGMDLGAGIVRDSLAGRTAGYAAIRVSEPALVTGNAIIENPHGIVTYQGSTLAGNVVGAFYLPANVAITAGASGNSVTGNTTLTNNGRGLSVSCPSLVLGNTSFTGWTGNTLTLSGPNCHADHNAAP